MGKVTPSEDSLIQNEIYRWRGTPLWGIVLAFLQIAIILIVFPIILHHYYPFFLSQGHPFYVTMFVTMGVHVLTLIGSNTMMYFIYKAKHPFFEQYRSEPDRLFPWEEDSKKWNSLVRRNILVLMFNVVFFLPFVAALITPDKEHLMFRHDVESWPTLWEMIWQVVFCSFCEDFMFYCTHRTLHTRWCYKHVHKRHHEYAQPVSIGGEFAHPFESFFGNMLPFYLGPILL